MPARDLTRYPIFLPGQPSGARLTLADVWQLCQTGYPEFRAITTEERTALVNLAYEVARLRGAKTIGQLTLEEMLSLNSTDHICSLTFERGSAVELSPVLAHCYVSLSPAHPLDCIGQLLGWLPCQLWGQEREKAKLDNVLPVNFHLRRAMSVGSGVITPTCNQLLTLIVELEGRVAAAISSTGSQWTLSTTFRASTAFITVQVEDGTKTRAMYAHEFMWVEASQTRHLYEHNDAVVDEGDGDRRIDHFGPSKPYGVNRYRPPLPNLASFASPSAAVASFVFFMRQTEAKWRTREEEEYWQLALYFCKLMLSVTSGRTFADVLATRPRSEALLPHLDSDVQSCAIEHAADQRHRRVFPTFASSSERDGKRKRSSPNEATRSVPRPEEVRVFEVVRVSRTPGESYGDDVYYSWRAARAGSKAEAQCEEEVLKSAVWAYETALNNHTRAVFEAYDSGRGGIDLFQLLLDWPAFDAAVGEERAEELQRLRDELKKAQQDVCEWLKKVVQRRRREEEQAETA